MNLQEFIAKWIDKYCESGGSSNALNQCVDLANQYIDEVLNFPKILWTNAVDFPSKAGNNYEFIKNTPTGVPSYGDLVIWKSSDGYGHIAIFLEGNVKSFTSFDENWPLNSKCHIQEHNYINVIGWLHPKKEDTMEISKKDFEKLMSNSLDRDALCEVLGYPKDTPLDTLKNTIAGLKGLGTSLAKAEAEIANRKEQVERLEKEIANLTTLKNKLIDGHNKLVSDMTKNNKAYEERINDLLVVIDDYAKKLGKANIALAECQTKAGYTSLIKCRKLELIKWK